LQANQSFDLRIECILRIFGRIGVGELLDQDSVRNRGFSKISALRIVKEANAKGEILSL
jgi:hypothetical protein